MNLVDSHCHFDMLKFDERMTDISAVIETASQHDVTHFLNVCVNLADFPRVLAVAKQFNNVFASVGVHPNEAFSGSVLSDLLELGNEERVIAIGETGLDYYRTQGDDVIWQQQRFREHIQAARQLKKPLIIHTRSAREDTIRILQEERANDVAGVMHCFGEDWRTAEQAMEMGFYISISGIVTFKNADMLRDIAVRVPLDRLLVETDAPYLAPEPHRGKQNQPAYVRRTAEFVAKLRGIELSLLAAQTTANFFALFSGAKHVV